MFELKELVGKKIVAIKGCNHGIKDIVTEYILFDDNETILYLREQDYYDYHDCSSSARELSVIKDKDLYNELMASQDYCDINTLF